MELFLILCAIAVVLVAFWLTSSQKSTTSPVSTPQPDAPQKTATAASAPPVDLSMLPRHFVVLDLETTGLDAEKHEIIEIGAMRVHVETSTADTFQVLVKPEKKVPKRITEITGITQEMVDREGQSIAEALPAFLEFVSDLPLVTFNADFDMAFLQNAASRHGLAIANRYTCALKMARRAWPGLPSYKLKDLAQTGNLSVEKAHRALGDCQLALPVFTSAASTLGKQIRWSKLPTEKAALQRAATAAE